jgi:hypothetical protein
LAGEKVASYNPEKKEDESEWQGEKLGWFHMVLRYATCFDHMLLWSGLAGATIFGGCLPGFCMFFGNMIDGVGDASATETANLQSSTGGP